MDRAILYETITDYERFGRTQSQMISDIVDLEPELIFRMFWQWGMTADSQTGLTEAVSAIKIQLPNCVLIGAIPAQRISQNLYNPETGTNVTYPDTWNMALDPTKWNINKSKISFQCEFGKGLNWYAGNCDSYNPSNITNYFPDLTNPEYQDLLLTWIYMQIDSGIDGVWIDMLSNQMKILYDLTQDWSHPSIIDTKNSIEYIITKIKEYGLTKGKNVYVGSWANLVYVTPLLDFITVSPTGQEVKNLSYNTSRWDTILNGIRNIEAYKSKKIYMFIDFANTIDTPLGQFSQVLTHDQQLQFLNISKTFCEENGMIFMYPVHGGWMMDNAPIKSFGRFNNYDSKAPEFKSYDWIKQLMLDTTPSTQSNHHVIAAGVIGLIIAGAYIIKKWRES